MKLVLLENVDFDVWSYSALPEEMFAVFDFLEGTGIPNPGFNQRSGVFTDATPEFTREVAAALLAYVHERVPVE